MHSCLFTYSESLYKYTIHIFYTDLQFRVAEKPTFTAERIAAERIYKALHMKIDLFLRPRSGPSGF